MKTKNILLNGSASFEVTESYKTLGANLKFLISKNDKCKIIAINSCLPGEGKSTTSLNLAITLAEDGNNVLVIDADMRAGRLNSFLSIEKSVGLSNFLCGEISDVKEIIEKTEIKNLYIIQNGDRPPNPISLLSSKKMDELLNFLSNEYDYIIIDTPPINVVSDVLALNDKIDGILFIIRERKSNFNEVKKAISQFEFAKMNILGIVMNDVKVKKRNGKYSRYEK